LSAPKPSTTTQSQVVERKYVHPSRNSRHVSGVASLGSRAGMRTPNNSAADSAQVAASIASAHPLPTVTTRRPPMVGPMIVMPLRVIDSRVLADCN
jgi:hypothetical protein